MERRMKLDRYKPKPPKAEEPAPAPRKAMSAREFIEKKEAEWKLESDLQDLRKAAEVARSRFPTLPSYDPRIMAPLDAAPSQAVPVIARVPDNEQHRTTSLANLRRLEARARRMIEPANTRTMAEAREPGTIRASVVDITLHERLTLRADITVDIMQYHGQFHLYARTEGEPARIFHSVYGPNADIYGGVEVSESFEGDIRLTLRDVDLAPFGNVVPRMFARPVRSRE